jgi:hypothetical protein
MFDSRFLTEIVAYIVSQDSIIFMGHNVYSRFLTKLVADIVSQDSIIFMSHNV